MMEEGEVFGLGPDRQICRGETTGVPPCLAGGVILVIPLRVQDHQVFTDQYLNTIENGNFVLKATVKAADLYYDPLVDYTKEKI